MDDVCALVNQKRALLTHHRYKVVTTWECEWNALKRNDPEVCTLVSDLDL